MRRITCYTLFDITQTGVKNRNRPDIDIDYNIWMKKRNSQCNYDTVLQAISMRSQPEQLSDVEKFFITFEEFENFGFLFTQQDEEVYPCWKFSFTVQHASVFSDGKHELGTLYQDCDGVPMLKTGEEFNRLPDFLDGTDELRNIYFKINYE